MRRRMPLDRRPGSSRSRFAGACDRTIPRLEVGGSIMDYQDYCEHVREHYPRLHPHLYTLGEEVFAQPFLRAVRAGSAKALRELCREVRPGVYVFEMLRTEFCREL